MYRYAQIDLQTKRVIGISQLYGEVWEEHLIPINGLNIELGSIYNADTKTFAPPNTTELVEQLLTTTEMQAQTLLNTELLLIYKEIGM